MIRSILVLIVTLAATTAAFGQPTTRPFDGPGPRPQRGHPPSAEEERTALAFVEKQMPILHQLLSETPKDSPRYRRLVRFAVDRHRWVERIRRDEQPEFYEQMLLRLKSQDDLFALAKRYENASGDARLEIREELRVKTRELVEHWLEERERRIENLRNMLTRELEQLERDQNRVDDLTDERLERFIDDIENPNREEPRRDGPRREGLRPERHDRDPSSRPSDR